MKKNFLVTTGLSDEWEFSETNFLLGKWCEFCGTSDFDKEEFNKDIRKKTSIVENAHHWDNFEKRIQDWKYVKGKLEYLLEIISDKLSAIHNINEDKEYWRVIIYGWLGEYTSTIFDKWEIVKIFFQENKNKKFYSNFIPFNELNYIPKNHKNSSFFIFKNDEWNHSIFLRVFNFLNIKNLSLIKKKVSGDNIKNINDKENKTKSKKSLIILIDRIVSKFSFKFNKVIFESFYFPKNEYLKICLKHKLIPSRYSNFFDFDIKENNLENDNKRIKLKNLLMEVNTEDQFIKFLLFNLHKDIPKSYLENFNSIKKSVLPFAKRKKIIFSMHSISFNDTFKVYIAETKKFGSKYIHVPHGGGLTFNHDPYFNHVEKISDKVIRWDSAKQKKDIFVNLSPTLPIINYNKPNKAKNDNNCSIVFYTSRRHRNINRPGPGLAQTINLFYELVEFVNKLNPEIKSKIKFRSKQFDDWNVEKIFSKIFGKKSVESFLVDSYTKTLSNSKLIIFTYAQTSFSEAMHSNIPSVLIMKKDYWDLPKESLHILDELKKSKIAFEDFNEAKIHINKCWSEIETWWKSENVQSSRKMYLNFFFNIKPGWFKEWSNYIYYSKKI